MDVVHIIYSPDMSGISIGVEERTCCDSSRREVKDQQAGKKNLEECFVSVRQKGLFCGSPFVV